jgi:hypothetical protein
LSSLRTRCRSDVEIPAKAAAAGHPVPKDDGSFVEDGGDYNVFYRHLELN